MKFGRRKFKIIILGLSQKAFCLLPSPSYCNMVYALRLTRSQLSLSLLLYFNERSAVKGRARHACYQNTGDWVRVRVYGQVAPSPPVPKVLFSFVLFLLLVFLAFFPLFPWSWGIAIHPLNSQNTKKTKQINKQKPTAEAPESHLACSYVARNL